jgi:excisionase family DNA binding protein
MTPPTPPERDDRILTADEVASIFRVDPKTVRRWANAGRLPSFRTLGGGHRYYASAVKKLLDDNSPDLLEEQPLDDSQRMRVVCV